MLASKPYVLYRDIDQLYKVLNRYTIMYFSIYRIHTDYGTYVGQTKNIQKRMVSHYSCKIWKKSPGEQKTPRYKAIVNTPDDRLVFEELGYYNVHKRQINQIEKYWIARTGANLNVNHKHNKRTLYLNWYDLERTSRIQRTPDQHITLDLKYQFDLMMITYKLQNLDIK